MRRRLFLSSLTGVIAGSLFPAIGKENAVVPAVKPDREWKALLSPQSYRVLFNEGTEPAGSSALNKETRAGTYVCAACYLPLFDSATKFDNGTGWPSFYDTLPELRT